MEKNTFDLEQLKEQIALLNKKLERENIVNEKLLKNAMSAKIRKVNNLAWTDLYLSIVAILMFFVIYASGNCSGWFFLFTVLMLAVSVTLSFITNKVKSDDLMSQDLIDVKKKVIEMKQQKRKTLLYYGIPAMVVWIPWAVYELSYKYDPEFFMWHAISLLIGALIGGLIGYHMYSKMQRRASEVLNQIEELEKE